MWFKNLVLYRFVEPFDLEPEAVAEALAGNGFRRCAGLDQSTYGWEPPAGRLSGELVHAANGCTLVCARREEKILPPAAVRDELSERVAAIEDHEQRVVGRKEKQRLRDQIVFEFLPRAFTRSQRTYAYLAPRDGWLVVDTSSPRRAEDLVLLLSDSLDELPVDLYAPPCIRRRR